MKECTKQTFATEQDAEKRIEEIRIECINSPYTKPYRCYECPNCGGWHLSSKPKQNFNKRNNEPSFNPKFKREKNKKLQKDSVKKIVKKWTGDIDKLDEYFYKKTRNTKKIFADKKLIVKNKF